MPFMKNKKLQFYLVYGITILLVSFCNIGLVKGQTEAIFYVSPNGNDSNSGKRDQPLATLEVARDALRKSQITNRHLVILPGEYFISKPFELNSLDNGLTVEAEQDSTVVLNGGSLVTKWYQDGDKFWCADLPGVKEGAWNFRTLDVNGHMAEWARYPDKGTFLHRQVWDVSWIDIHWERPATYEERTTMTYDPKDIPESLDVRNAEVRVYHMWSESLVGVARNDTQRHALIFSNPSNDAPGAFGIKKYVIYNTREGMTRPGQWYLDRTAGRVVYWPLKDENMTKAKVIAPRIEQILNISGSKEKKVENITIKGLSFIGTTASWFKGAVNIEFANQCTLEKLDIFNAGGFGLLAQQMSGCSVIGCDIHHTGRDGAKFTGSDSFISGNKIHNTGINYPSAVGLSARGENLHIFRNEVYNIPYSGMTIGGNDQLVEENHIHHVMQEMHDGAAIYSGSGKRIIYRGNLAHDIVANGKGFGISSYYFDSGTRDCIMERNISLRVARPIHLDYTTNATLHDNTFISDSIMVLSFQQSADCIFERNTIVASGNIRISQPNAVKIWKDNVIYRNGQVINGVSQSFIIDSAMPPYSIPERKTYPVKAMHISKSPILDGNIEYNEWPKQSFLLDREPSRLPASGWYPRIKVSYDDKFLYLGGNIIMRDPGLIIKGSTWGKNDGFEVSIAGNTSKGKPANFVVRVYPDGTVQSLTDAGAPAGAAQRLGKDLRVVINDQKPNSGGGWSCELAIPLKALGLKPVPGLTIPFNMCAYVNEYDNWHYWEGTQVEGWNMNQAGMLRFD